MEYEILVLGDGLGPSLIFKGFHESDDAAIRTGHATSSGHGFEVWRDTECIHREPPHPAI